MATKTEAGGQLLREWREGQGLTCTQLGNLLGISQARVSQIETGEQPSLKLALQIETVTARSVPVQSWHQPGVADSTPSPAASPPERAA